MKQTAVEWLLNEMQKTYIFNQDDFDMFKRALEIEKQQLCYFYSKGAEAEINNPYKKNIEFYNENFKK